MKNGDRKDVEIRKLHDDNGRCVKLSFADLVQSVLPWPFNKDLPANYCGMNPENRFWDLFLLTLRTPTPDAPREKTKNANEPEY